MAIHVFPQNLRDASKQFPFMDFVVTQEGQAGPGADTVRTLNAVENIYLPIPSGLTFSDSAIYSNFNLGILGMIGANAVSSGLATASTAGGSAMDKAKAIGSSVVTSLKEDTIKSAVNGNVAAAASIAARQIARQDDVANVIDYASKQIIAPNTRTSFDGTSIRSFSFNFKLVGRTKKETEDIKKITRIFQEYMYPEGNKIIMKYPPVWQIGFFNPDGTHNSNIPGIYDCFLVNYTPTYNASTNIFYDDGAPVEIDISLGFQETKALTRNEIRGLNRWGPWYASFSQAYGVDNPDDIDKLNEMMGGG